MKVEHLPSVESQIGAVTRFRWWIVTLFIVGLTGASFYDIIRDDDHWPFSNYGMYSNIESTNELTRLRVFGVRDSGVEQILTDADLLEPFDQARLEAALAYIVGNTVGHLDQRRQLLSTALSDLSRRYEALRVDGRHTGPRLKSLRLYLVSWQLDPWARNVNQPFRKDLLIEIPARGVNSHE